MPTLGPTELYSNPELSTVGPRGATLEEHWGEASASLHVPPGALPSGTEVGLAAVSRPESLATEVPLGQEYLVSFAVSWVSPSNSSPAAVEPLTIVIMDPAVRVGDAIYMWTRGGLKVVGTARFNGQITLTFATDPDFVVAAVPRLSAVASEATVAAGAVSLSMACRAGVVCRGSAELTARWRTGTARHSASVASGAFLVPAGRAEIVSFRDTSAGRKVLWSDREGSLSGMLAVKLVGGRPANYPVKLPYQRLN